MLECVRRAGTKVRARGKNGCHSKSRENFENSEVKFKSGNLKSGNYKIGNSKSGNLKSGNFISGNLQSGNWQSVNYKSAEPWNIQCPVDADNLKQGQQLKSDQESKLRKFKIRENLKSGQLSGYLKRRQNQILLLLIIILLCVRSSSSGVSLGAHLVCARVVGLTEKQRAMCRAAPAAIAAVGDGMRMAYGECRVQLSGHRWNCTGIGDGNHFGHLMPLATREAAFTYAITAAGVTHALSTACARGEIPTCGCNRRRVINPSEQFQWGGCGEAAYGARFARRFLDARELEEDARSLMNLHNNRVGRKMVKDLVRRECKCHGVSGSCAVKTCWRALPQFTAVARVLREKYLKAKMVAPHPPPSTHAPNTHLVIRRSRQSLAPGRQPRKNELVYLEPSPSYCEPDSTTGSLGTHGRHCDRASRGEEGCETLCCGRGYNTVRTTEETKCRCKFHWCCRVTCDTCLNVSEVHVCK